MEEAEDVELLEDGAEGILEDGLEEVQEDGVEEVDVVVQDQEAVEVLEEFNSQTPLPVHGCPIPFPATLFLAHAPIVALFPAGPKEDPAWDVHVNHAATATVPAPVPKLPAPLPVPAQLRADVLQGLPVDSEDVQ